MQKCTLHTCYRDGGNCTHDLTSENRPFLSSAPGHCPQVHDDPDHKQNWSGVLKRSRTSCSEEVSEGIREELPAVLSSID